MNKIIIALVIIAFSSVAFAQADVRVISPVSTFYDVIGQKVTGTVQLKNFGNDMPTKNIIEMQVRPAGAAPLAIIDSQSTCDSATPENVHVSFQLFAGETSWITLRSDRPPGDYDIHFFSRTQCGGTIAPPWNFWGANKQGFVRVPTGSGTVTTTSSLPGIPSGDLKLVAKTVNVVGSKITSRVGIRNEGQSMTSGNILEMQVRPNGSPALSIIGGQKTCDPTQPNNVHKTFIIANGQTETIELTSTDLPQGLYDVYLFTRSKCQADVNNPAVFENTAPLPGPPVAEGTYEIKTGTGGGGGLGGNTLLIIGIVVLVIIGAVLVLR